MIIHANGMRNRLQHLRQARRNLPTRHSRNQFLRLGRLLAHRLHREMQHDLNPAAVRFLSNFGGVFVVWEHGNRERAMQGKKSASSTQIPFEI